MATSAMTINAPADRLNKHEPPCAPIPQAPTGQMLGRLADLSFTQLVNDALRNYPRTLALSRSALANSQLVTPTLVKDEASPTAEERGHGLRLVLQWAVNQLAPGTAAYPLGTYRPLDDPTWRDPHWWRYNILRHRYLEPLHPDDFVGGGRYTESLLALTGISSPDAFFDERNRAIRTLAERLRQQLIDGRANSDLQRLALQEALLPLEKQDEAAKLLGIAAIFDDIFPRGLLVEMIQQEQNGLPAAALDALTTQRFLLTDTEETNLWLSPILRAYVYERQSKADCQRRHRLAAAYYEAQAAPLLAARHWRRAQQDARAVRVLFPVVDELIHELHGKELIEFFQQLDPKRLVDEQWYAVQLRLSDLFQRSGQHEEALAAGRQALQASADPTKQARVYRRIGKLYEIRNQLHALRYYQQAAERFQPTDPELAELLKDRGWLYCLRKEWDAAQNDLQQALHVAPQTAHSLRADIYDAMASLHRGTGKYRQALTYAENALSLREEGGDLMRIAKSLGNLGLLYRAMGEYGPAAAAHQEALHTYQKLGNQELTATALLNLGATYFLAQKLPSAIAAYQQSLTICQAITLPLIEIKAHYNLAEAFAAIHQTQAAQQHWQAGYDLCRQLNFDDQEALFLVLHTTLALPELNPRENNTQHAGTAEQAPKLDTDEQLLLSLLATEGVVTPKRLMDVANISRATATRRLTTWVEKGLLQVEGKGRGTVYCRATQAILPTVIAEPANKAAQAADMAAIQAVLQRLKLDLTQQYAITAMGVVLPSAAVSLIKLVVRFEPLPDLTHYLQLKRHLASCLGCEIDLLLAEDTGTLPAEACLLALW